MCDDREKPQEHCACAPPSTAGACCHFLLAVMVPVLAVLVPRWAVMPERTLFLSDRSDHARKVAAFQAPQGCGEGIGRSRGFQSSRRTSHRGVMAPYCGGVFVTFASWKAACSRSDWCFSAVGAIFGSPWIYVGWILCCGHYGRSVRACEEPLLLRSHRRRGVLGVSFPCGADTIRCGTTPTCDP